MVQNEIYVIGGYDGRRELDLADVYATTTNEWRRLPPLSTPRGGLSVVYDGLAIFALGGGWTHPLDTLERFDPMRSLGVILPLPCPANGVTWRLLATTTGFTYSAVGVVTTSTITSFTKVLSGLCYR